MTMMKQSVFYKRITVNITMRYNMTDWKSSTRKKWDLTHLPESLNTNNALKIIHIVLKHHITASSGIRKLRSYRANISGWLTSGEIVHSKVGYHFFQFSFFENTNHCWKFVSVSIFVPSHFPIKEKFDLSDWNKENKKRTEKMCFFTAQTSQCSFSSFSVASRVVLFVYRYVGSMRYILAFLLTYWKCSFTYTCIKVACIL